MRKYYGVRIEGAEVVVMYAVISGQMSDGTRVYTEIDPSTGEYINADAQYIRTLRQGWQMFERL